MNILAVGANPDDIEALCAGTLALCAKRGDKVAMCYLTMGDKGSAEIPPEKIAAIRRKEAEASAAVIGALSFPLEIPDGHVEVTLAMRKKIVEVIRQVKPDLIITHYPHDYMSDHNYTSQLALDASFWSGAPYFGENESRNPPVERRPAVFYMDTLCGLGFVPEEYVDITPVMETKIKMLMEHKSQIDFMKNHDGLDFAEYVRTAARYRGYQCGATYAEGFIPARVFPHVRSRRLLP